MKTTTTAVAVAAASEKRGGPKHQFPDILYNMLELAHASPGSSSDTITGRSNSNFPITWCENGRSFHIIDRVAFEGLLPMYFKVRVKSRFIVWRREAACMTILVIYDIKLSYLYDS